MDMLRRLMGVTRHPPGPAFPEEEVYPLHLQDYNFRRLLMVMTMRFDDVLDAEKLNKALSQLLETGDWRKLGGRLRSDGAGKLEIHVPRQFSEKRPEVTFSHNDISETRIADHFLANQLPVPTKNTSIQPNPYNLINLGVRPDIPKTVEDMVDRDLPQISLHVTSFQDATLVAISWPHCVMDSLGFKTFLHAWSLVLGGQPSAVPNLLGARHDVLLEAESDGLQEAREPFLLEPSRLKGAKLVSFVIRYLWTMIWGPAPEVKTIFLPKLALARLYNQCLEEISAETPDQDEKPSVSEESALLAWLTRFATAFKANTKPLTIINFFNARSVFQSLANRGGVYVQNMACQSFAFLSPKLARGYMGAFIQEHQRQIQEQTTEQQCLSFLRAYRQATEDGNSFKPFFGEPDAQILVFNNLSAANVMHAVDFSAAVLKHVETTESKNPPGTMTCYYYHIINNRLGCGPDCIYMLGKDYGENLWLVAALPARAWGKIEEALGKL
ncbi:Transcriptional regulator sdnM [Lachnellula suecica]|uniref:Transcriptional regulator sdnM n=1 Tax=Lachnellula suecica TaxID=602035 RepID=A0A8T9BUI1_9HELO|nr:Transcriptional regulator sdnM [Lachnellula suecica]